MRFESTVAVRFLREGGLQTLMIIAGAAAGISVIVFITSFLGDLQTDLIRRTLGVQPNIIVRPAEEVARPLREGSAALPQIQARVQRLRSVDQWQSLRLRLESLAGVRAVSPVAAGPGLVTRGDTNKSVTVTGIIPQHYAAVTRFNEKIAAGELRLSPGDTIIGTDLARDLGVGIGDKIRISTPTSPGDAYQIRAIYDLGQRSLNRAYAYVSLPTAQALLDLPGGISSLEMALDDLFDAENMAQQLQKTIPHEVESWMRANPQLRTALGNQTIMTLLIRLFLALVVAIGVASVLVVSVVQKTREIGILRAMGASRARILRVFLLQGAIIGLIGAIAGCLGGVSLTAIMSQFVRAEDGAQLFQAHLDGRLYLFTIIGACVVGLLAAIMPARRAARLDPAQAIRI